MGNLFIVLGSIGLPIILVGTVIALFVRDGSLKTQAQLGRESKQERALVELEARLTTQVQQLQEWWRTWEARATARLEAVERRFTIDYELAHALPVDELPLSPDGKVPSQPLIANWRPVMLYRADLCGRDLAHRSLRGADLREAQLVGTNFFMADLAGACLSGANLSGADLSGANLAGADLRGASLTGANLLVADFHEAVLFGANLLGTRSLTIQQLETARYDRATQFDDEIKLNLARNDPDLSPPTIDREPTASEPSIEAYCVKCKKKTAMQHAHQVIMKNRRTAMQGNCSICGTSLFRIGAPKQKVE